MNKTNHLPQKTNQPSTLENWIPFWIRLFFFLLGTVVAMEVFYGVPQFEGALAPLAMSLEIPELWAAGLILFLALWIAAPRSILSIVGSLGTPLMAEALFLSVSLG